MTPERLERLRRMNSPAIDELIAEVEKLQPFARIMADAATAAEGCYGDFTPPGYVCKIPLGDCRRAREALE